MEGIYYLKIAFNVYMPNLNSKWNGWRQANFFSVFFLVDDQNLLTPTCHLNVEKNVCINGCSKIYR